MKLQPIGSNQTVLRFEDKAVLFSYETPVAVIMYNDETEWTATHKAYKTDKQWSRTTSKHINSWLKYYDWVDIKPQSFFDNLIGE
jgi:hypothetical protein